MKLVELAIYEKELNIAWVDYKFIEQRIDAQYYKKEFVENEIKIKQINNLPLKGIYTRGDYGTLPDSADYSQKGIYLIRGTDLRDLSIKEDDLILVPEEYFSDKSEVKSEDILILIKGATIDAEWSVSIVPKINYKAIFNGSIFRIRLKKEYAPYFITAFMSTKYFLNQKKRAISNTGIYYNDKDSIENFIIPIPSPDIQKYIGNKVRKAEELREEAKRLKKEAEEILNDELKLSYFNERVKYAPKMYNWMYGESIEARIDSQYYINETNFINTEMNKKGLKFKKISEVASVGKGFSYTSLDKKTIPYIRISDLDDLLINFDSVELVDEKTYSEKKSSQLEQYDLIFAITGATIGKVSLFYNSKCGKATLSSDTAFARLKDKNDAAYVLLYLKSSIGQISILKGVTGATNRHLSLEHIGDIFIPVIDNKLKREINIRVIKAIDNIFLSKQLIKEAKQDVENLIEGNFSMKE